MNGESLAAAEAVAIAEAYAEAQAASKTCGKCHVAGEAIAASFKEIYIKATAAIEFVFNGIADGTEINTVFEVVSESISKATVTAFAEAIATAHAEDHKCSVGAEAHTGAGVPGDISSATSCKINLVAAADEVISDALVDVAAEAATKVCSGDIASGSAEFEVEGTAVAKAMARAMTAISSSCYTKGKGYGCAAGEAEITKTATVCAPSSQLIALSTLQLVSCMHEYAHRNATLHWDASPRSPLRCLPLRSCRLLPQSSPMALLQPPPSATRAARRTARQCPS